MAGKTLLKGLIAPITVGHVPRELSRHTWYAIQEVAQFEATVNNTNTRPHVIQGGLKIPEELSTYITKVEETKYLVTGECVDDSKEIPKDLVGPEAVESLDDDEDYRRRLLNSLYYYISFLEDLV